MAETIDNESITIIGNEVATVTQLPAELEANVAAIKVRTQSALKNVDLDKDFDFSRTNLIQALNTGLAALEELSFIARQSQHPRAYEVLAMLMKNLSDTNDKLLDLHEKKINISQPTEETDQGTGSNRPLFGNAMFVGSTTELLHLINKNRNG